MGLAQGSTSRHQLNLPRTWGGKSLCFALVHPFSGSDATSQFNGKGKMSAWKAWKKYLATTAGCTSASQDGFVALEFTYAASRLTVIHSNVGVTLNSAQYRNIVRITSLITVSSYLLSGKVSL